MLSPMLHRGKPNAVEFPLDSEEITESEARNVVDLVPTNSNLDPKEALKIIIQNDPELKRKVREAEILKQQDMNMHSGVAALNNKVTGASARRLGITAKNFGGIQGALAGIWHRVHTEEFKQALADWNVPKLTEIIMSELMVQLGINLTSCLLEKLAKKVVVPTFYEVLENSIKAFCVKIFPPAAANFVTPVNIVLGIGMVLVGLYSSKESRKSWKDLPAALFVESLKAAAIIALPAIYSIPLSYGIDCALDEFAAKRQLGEGFFPATWSALKCLFFGSPLLAPIPVDYGDYIGEGVPEDIIHEDAWVDSTFECSISNGILVRPVCVHGHVFERAAIEEWLATCNGDGSHPQTRRRFNSNQIILPHSNWMKVYVEYLTRRHTLITTFRAQNPN